MADKPAAPIVSLERSLRKRFPDAQIVLDKPRAAAGVWYLDVTRDGHSVVIQWQGGKGFGVSASLDYSYGEGADEIYQDQEAAYGRVISLLLSRGFTSAPPTSLRELRKESRLSQAELAEVLNKQQGEVSKIERRRDVLVSTLSDYARAVDGELQIIVRLSDGRVRRVQLEEGPEDNRAPGKTRRH